MEQISAPANSLNEDLRVAKVSLKSIKESQWNSFLISGRELILKYWAGEFLLIERQSKFDGFGLFGSLKKLNLKTKFKTTFKYQFF